MTRNLVKLSILAATLCTLSMPVMAEPDRGRGRDHDDDRSSSSERWKNDRRDRDDRRDYRSRNRAPLVDRSIERRHSRNDGTRIFISFGAPERVVVRERMSVYYDRYCPPGLTKRRYGCVPYGHAKRYMVGHPLPYYVEYWSVPSDVLVSLPPAPYGTRYIWADRDILLISESNGIVLDALVVL